MVIGANPGTINNLTACCRGGEAAIALNRLNENLTLSVMTVDKRAQILMGKTAGEHSYLHPGQSAEVFKRFMGSDKQYELGGHKFRPGDLSAIVIWVLKEDAEEFSGEAVTEAAIGIPAYFDDKRRKATKLAGELAGLKVERIISEPTATTITCRLYDRTENTRFLVFDSGGDTFDMSTLESYGSILEVWAVAGNNYLGGENFTRVLEKEFLEKNETDEEELDRKTATTVHEAVENRKKPFSQGDKAMMKCEINGEEKVLTIDLKEYGELCRPFLRRIRKPLQRSISDAHVKLFDIDEVVLVGGATRLPVIRESIVKLFHKFPNISVHSDEAVALGAAVQGAVKVRDKEVKEIILTDTCAFTLGTEMSVERREGVYESGHFCPIIERNTVILTSRTERFYTAHDKQKKIRINVYQRENHLAVNNLLLGSLEILVSKNKAGEGAMDVTYTHDINLILEVEVKVISTGKVKKQIIKGKYNTMTDKEIQVRIEEFFCLKIAPRDQEENRLLLFKGEQYYKESTGDRRLMIENCMRESESALDSKDRERITDAERRLREEISRGEEQEEKIQRTRQKATRMLPDYG